MSTGGDLAHAALDHHISREGRAIIRISGEIDLSNADRVLVQIRAVCNGAAAVVVDLTGLHYFDSQGLGMLTRLATELDHNHTDLTVVAPGESIAATLLRITCLDEHIRVRPSFDGPSG